MMLFIIRSSALTYCLVGWFPGLWDFTESYFTNASDVDFPPASRAVAVKNGMPQRIPPPESRHEIVRLGLRLLHDSHVNFVLSTLSCARRYVINKVTCYQPSLLMAYHLYDCTIAQSSVIAHPSTDLRLLQVRGVSYETSQLLAKAIRQDEPKRG